MDFHNFTLFMSLKSRNPLLTFLLSYHVWVTSKIQVNFRFERYWWYCLMNCWNFQTIHVFEVRESIADIFTELLCLNYLKNLGQLPVQGYLRGTDNFIWWIFTISSLFMFSRSRNPLLTFLLSYDFWVTSIIQVNFRFERYWWFCLMNFWNFYTIRVFGVRESIADISTELPCVGHVTSCYVMSRNSRKSRHVTSCYVMSRNFTLCHVMPRHVTSCHVMSRFCHVMSRHVLPGHVTSCHVTSCYVRARHVTSKVAGRSHDQRSIVNWLFPHAIHLNWAWPCSLVVPKAADTIPHQRYMI